MKYRNPISVWLAPLIVLFAAILVAGPSEAESLKAPPELPFEFYSTVNGLTQSEVSDVAQDSAGYLWVATPGGLNRYDGREFSHYTIANGLPLNDLTAVAPATDGGVWVGDRLGTLSLIRGDRVVTSVSPASGSGSIVTSITISDAGVYVATATAGLFVVEESSAGFTMRSLWKRSTSIEDVQVSLGRLWFVTDGGLYSMVSGDHGEPQLEFEGVARSHIAGDTTHWVLDDANQLGTFYEGVFQFRRVLDGDDSIVEMAAGHEGELWLLGESSLTGIVERKGADGISVTQLRNYPEISQGYSLFVDRENTLWIGSMTRLARFLGDRFVHYYLRTGTDGNTVWSITADAAGRFYFGTEDELLRLDSPTKLSALGAKTGIPGGPVRDLLVDENQVLWAGVRGHGVYKVDIHNDRAELVSGTEGMEVLDLCLCAPDEIWIATMAGVFRFETGNQVLENISVAGDTAVFTIDGSPDGSVWVGAEDLGLIKMTPREDSTFDSRVYSATDGITTLSFNQIRVIQDDELWIGTEDGGLYRFDHGAFSNLAADTPIRDQSAYFVEPLADGSIVVGAQQGLYQIDPESRRSHRYNPAQGFLGVESNIHATYRNSNGNLWIGTVQGATYMDTTQPMPRRLDLTPQIMRLESQSSHLAIASGAELVWSDRGIVTEFSSISLREPNAISYSYRLLGLDSQWSSATDTRTVGFSNLAAGTYSFEVRARYPGGPWGVPTRSGEFAVLAPFWRTTWFNSLCVLALLLLAFLCVRWRTARINAANAHLRKEVLIRTHSIERARAHLENSNKQLSEEIRGRHEADQARIEVEARFRQAFENTPIGMGLISITGELLDANPSLRRMLWPDISATDDCGSIIDAIAEDARQDFQALSSKLTSGAKESLQAEFVCHNSQGEELQTVVTVAAVRDEQGNIKYLVLQIQDITEARQLTDQLEYQANYDELTGLLNRRSFEAALQRAFSGGGDKENRSYLMFMDLDQFKVVNDTSGHGAGDELLKRISTILKGQVRNDDAVGRLGGDEFGIILWECPFEVANRVAEKIRLEIEELQFRWDKETYRIGVSIGVVPVRPGVGDIAELQQLADAACYQAKEAGRNRVHMVHDEGESVSKHRGEVRWVQRLRDAMDNKRFALYGQIIRPLHEESEDFERMEVLLRMRDPVTRKLIPPGAFLPAAERYGVCLELDKWVVKNLLDMLFTYDAFGAADRRYWVNLSGASVGDTRFADFLIDAIRHSPLPEGMINFEITETAVIRNIDEAGRLMTKLRDMGCQFALDDFGSGLSSFGYLKKLPVDFLKIDGMFVRDIANDQVDRIFVKSIIDIAHTMGIGTIAEFVENDAILAIVSELGADYAQGFGIHRPEMLMPQFPVAIGTSGLDDLAREQAK